jgi:hypothetical protein
MKSMKGKKRHTRRLFIISTILSVLFSFVMVNIFKYKLIEWFYRFRNRFKKRKPYTHEYQKKVITLPTDGTKIYLETALNSRCNCDTDDDPNVFHWGMFDNKAKLSEKDLERIVNAAKIPKITRKSAEFCLEGNEITFKIEAISNSTEREWLMVESGMQQQAVCIVCAALGAGMVFRNMGKDGTKISERYIGTIRMKIDAMEPSYDGSYWSTNSPKKPWKKGNLPDPNRAGTRPLLSVLKELSLEDKGNVKVNDQTLSQVLWAIRGRTPHRYKSRAWGLTIPTWGGKQDITNIFMTNRGTLYKYVNLSAGWPTHHISIMHNVDEGIEKELEALFGSYNSLVIFGRNEEYARALWEVGYQFLNGLLQAANIKLNYQGFILDKAQKVPLKSAGINMPVAVLALY